MANDNTARSQECRDRIRFTLSNETGIQRFKDFKLVEAPECGAMGKLLQEYLVGRPLAEVDLAYLRSLKCPYMRSLECQENGGCVLAIIDVIREFQDLFVGHR